MVTITPTADNRGDAPRPDQQERTKGERPDNGSAYDGKEGSDTDTDEDISKPGDSLMSSRQRRKLLDDAVVSICQLGKSASRTQNQLNMLSETVSTIGAQFIRHQQDTKRAVDVVDSKVDLVDEKVDCLSKSLQEMRGKLARKDETAALFMPYMPSLFNGETGVVGLCPVGYEDGGGVMHKLVVVSLPLLIWYFERAKDGVRIPELTIRSFFSSGQEFMLYPKFPYPDFVDITLRTPYKIRAIGKNRDRNEPFNRNNILIYEGSSVQKALAQAKRDYPAQTAGRLSLADSRKVHSHGHDGNKIAYTQGNLKTTDSGPILIYGNKNFQMNEKAQIPAMGYPWTVENYDLPYVREFFNTTKALQHGRHIVGGEVLPTSSLVLTHAQEYKKRSKQIEADIVKASNKRRRRRYGKKTKFTNLQTASILIDDLVKIFEAREHNTEAFNEAFRNLQSVITLYHGVKFGGDEPDMMLPTRMTNYTIRASKAMEAVYLSTLGAGSIAAADVEKAMMNIQLSVEEFINFAREKTKHVAPRRFRTPDSDVMSPVILDMPTGTGKTITSILGALLFAIERQSDMQQKTTLSPTSSGLVEVTDMPGWDPHAVLACRRCVAFTPRHLMQHWINHALIAKKIVETMTFADGARWKVKVVLNKKLSSISVGHGEVVLGLCDSSRCGVKKYLEPSVHYSAICFDEAGESDSKINALCQTMVPNVSHGRTILISADFSKWRYYFEPRAASVLRHIFPFWDRFRLGYVAAAICTSAAVFTGSERAAVMQECTDALASAVVDIACVKYRPSLVERVGGGYGAELGNDRGCDFFRTEYGVDVSSCSTFNDITAKIDSAIDRHKELTAAPEILPTALRTLRDEINALRVLRDRLEAVLSEDCPICLERKTDLKIIQPCMHFTCSECMARLQVCPMCRGEMAGTVGLSCTDRPLKKQKTPQSSERIGSLFFDEMATLTGFAAPTGVMQAIQYTLQAVQNARRNSNRAGKTLRTMLICPGSNMREGLFADMGFEVMHYKTVGSKNDVVTSRRMNATMDSFKADDGASKLLCVRDASTQCKKDSMTGLDIPNLDCVVSIGGSNVPQRMGRLCRLSRMSLPDDERHALFVEVVPAY
eukprot:g16373.t1